MTLIPETQAETFAGAYSTPTSYDAQPWYWTSPSPAILWIVWRPSTAYDPNGSNSSFYNNAELGERHRGRQHRHVDRRGRRQVLRRGAGDHPERGRRGRPLRPDDSIAVAKNLHDVWLEKSQGEPVFEDAYLTK